jgi:hypothetical protein
MIETLGWIATTVFVASYFFARPGWLRAAQMGGATLWIVYGCLIGAVPVIAANVLVFCAAAWTLGRQWRQQSRVLQTVPKSAPASLT